MFAEENICSRYRKGSVQIDQAIGHGRHGCLGRGVANSQQVTVYRYRSALLFEIFGNGPC